MFLAIYDDGKVRQLRNLRPEDLQGIRDGEVRVFAALEHLTCNFVEIEPDTEPKHRPVDVR